MSSVASFQYVTKKLKCIIIRKTAEFNERFLIRVRRNLIIECELNFYLASRLSLSFKRFALGWNPSSQVIIASGSLSRAVTSSSPLQSYSDIKGENPTGTLPTKFW